MQPPLPGEHVDPYMSTVPDPAWGQTPVPPRRRRRVVAPVVATTALLAVVGVLAATLGLSNTSTPVSNAQLLALVHSASKALTRTPATTFTMTVDVSAFGHTQSIEMAGTSSTANRASTMTVSGPGIRETAVELGGIAYISVPGAAQQLNDGKAWIAVRAPKPTPEMQQLEAAGPAGFLKGLAQVGGKIEDDGTQNVRGAQTTEYSFHIDLLKLLGPNFAKVMGRIPPTVARSLGLDNMPMKVWLDHQGLPRELALDFGFSGVSFKEVAYMTPSSVAPTITAPPASTVRMASSLGQFGRMLRQIGYSRHLPQAV